MSLTNNYILFFLATSNSSILKHYCMSKEKGGKGLFLSICLTVLVVAVGRSAVDDVALGLVQPQSLFHVLVGQGLLQRRKISVSINTATPKRISNKTKREALPS